MNTISNTSKNTPPRDVEPYFASIRDIPLLNREEERCLFDSIIEKREVWYDETFRVDRLRQDALELYRDIKSGSLDYRKHLEFGKTEGEAVSKRLACNLKTMISIVEQLHTCSNATDRIRLEKKLSLLALEIRFKDPIMMQLCQNHLRITPAPALSNALDDFIKVRNKIMVANLRLVISLAKKRENPGSLQDYIQAGNAGLMRAIERFEPSKRVKFSTYATPWIKQGIQREIESQGRTIREPTHLSEVKKEIQRAQTALQAAQLPDSDAYTIHRWLKEHPIKRRKLPSAELIEHVLLPRQQVKLAPSIEPTKTETRDTNELFGIPLATVERYINLLDSRTAAVIKCRFGFGARDAETLVELGKRLGISKERVRQIQEVGLRKLKEMLAESHSG